MPLVPDATLQLAEADVTSAQTVVDSVMLPETPVTFMS
jgi:hypothetical protein